MPVMAVIIKDWLDNYCRIYLFRLVDNFGQLFFIALIITYLYYIIIILLILARCMLYIIVILIKEGKK